MDKLLPKGWRRITLRDCVASIASGVSVNGDDQPAFGPDKGVLKVSAVSAGRFMPSENKKIVAQDLERARLNPKAGCLLMSRANTPELVGSVAYVDRDYPNLFLSDKLWQISLPDDGDLSAKWLAAVLSSDASRKTLMELATGSSRSMRNISQEAFLDLEIPLPPSDEQHGATTVLEACDQAIILAEHSSAKTQQRFREFTQKLTLSGVNSPMPFRAIRSKQPPRQGWKRLIVADVAHEVGRFNRERLALPVLSSTKSNGVVFSGEYFGKQVYSANTSTYKRVCRGEFVYATNHIEEGSIGLQDICKEGLVSPMYTVFGVDEAKANPEFLFALFKTEIYRQIFQANTSASVDRRGSLRWKDFSKLPVYLPVLDIQNQIVEALSEGRRQVEFKGQRLHALRNQKRGLMQKLLTGQWRLPRDLPGMESDRV